MSKKVLILRFSSVGDVVLASPAVEALKSAWPDSEVVWLIKSAFSPLIEHNPHVDRVVTFESGESLRQVRDRVRNLELDAVLDLHKTLRSVALRWTLRARQNVVWSKRPLRDHIPVRMALRPYQARMTIAERYHRAVEELVGRSVERGQLRHFVGDEQQAEADRALQTAGADPHGKLVGFSPGASWPTKLWPTDRFRQLARNAAEAGWQVVITGSPAERRFSTVIREAVPDAVDLTGHISVGALGGVINRCAAFVANDSGPMHMARALGVPTLAFFGSTDPRQFELEPHALMFAGVECSPCHFYGRKRCPKGHFRCMLELSVDAAWEKLEGLLADGGRTPFVKA